jgi:hypothetical protein
MAMLHICPGFEVQILVNGQVLPEYEKEKEPEDDDTVTKYVEAQSGKEFAIKYKFNVSFKWKHMSVSLTIWMVTPSVVIFRIKKLTTTRSTLDRSGRLARNTSSKSSCPESWQYVRACSETDSEHTKKS